MRPRSLIKSFNYAIEGIIYALRTQRNMRIHFIVAAVVLTGSLFLGVSRLEFLALLFAITLVIMAELINSAVETAIDVVSTTHDPLAKIAKDVAAAAVLVASLNAVVVGYLIFFFRLKKYTLGLVQRVIHSPIHLTLIALILVMLLVIVIKAWVGEGTFLRGGWPSGHAALATALFTAIAFISQDPFVATLGLIMVILVIQSRLEMGVHSILQMLAGMALGFLVTVLLFQFFYA